MFELLICIFVAFYFFEKKKKSHYLKRVLSRGSWDDKIMHQICSAVAIKELRIML